MYRVLKKLKSQNPNYSLHAGDKVTPSPQPNESRPPNINHFIPSVENVRKIRRTQSSDLLMILKQGLDKTEGPKPTIGIITEDK